MSEILTQILEALRVSYLELLESKQGAQPLYQAQQLCAQQLNIDADSMAAIIHQDATLLAARANAAPQEQQENASAGYIIAINVYNAALEMLLQAAIEAGWLEADSEGVIQFDPADIAAAEQVLFTAPDYSVSQIALDNVSNGSTSPLQHLFSNAEAEFVENLGTQVSDAYLLAIQTAGSYSVFSPEDIAPLVVHNPLLLGLRGDDLVIDEVFENDPPAGIVISSHITQLIVDHLLEIAVEKGALALDAQGQIIHIENDDKPVLH